MVRVTLQVEVHLKVDYMVSIVTSIIGGKASKLSSSSIGHNVPSSIKYSYE